jgi:hypothetical protein
VHIVCRNGSASGFRTLIIKGADTNCRDMVSKRFCSRFTRVSCVGVTDTRTAA